MFYRGFRRRFRISQVYRDRGRYFGDLDSFMSRLWSRVYRHRETRFTTVGTMLIGNRTQQSHDQKRTNVLIKPVTWLNYCSPTGVRQFLPTSGEQRYGGGCVVSCPCRAYAPFSWGYGLPLSSRKWLADTDWWCVRCEQNLSLTLTQTQSTIVWGY